MYPLCFIFISACSLFILSISSLFYSSSLSPPSSIHPLYLLPLLFILSISLPPLYVPPPSNTLFYSVCPSLFYSVCPSLFYSVCPSLFYSVCPSLFYSVCPSLFYSVCPSLFYSVCPSLFYSVCPSLFSTQLLDISLCIFLLIIAGTHDIHALILGRAITGIQAFSSAE